MKSTRNEEPSQLLTTPLYTPNSELARIDRALFSEKHRISVTGTSQTLFTFLSSALPHIEPATWPMRAEFGGLYVNGRRTSSDQALPDRAVIEYYEPRYDYTKPEYFYPQFTPDLIVYEDEYMAVLFKPAGLPTHPNKEQTTYSLRTYAERHYKRSVHLPSRLDTGTAGLVPMSINLKMHQPLQRLFERRLVKKRYLCAIEGDAFNTPLRIDCGIGRSTLHSVLREARNDTSHRAITEITPVQKTEGAKTDHVFLLAAPITGRTHQIRVHCASFLGPIVGDHFYGGPQASELHLMCIELSFFHPFRKEETTVRVPTQLIPQWARSAAL
ncbi:MAG: RluA family pseudouridine synthase [Bdellovibrionota bacterium]